MKSLRNLFLFVAATAAVLYVWALFTVASQSSDPTGLYHASITDWPALAVDHIKRHLAVFLRWGAVLLVALPIVTKTILNLRHDRNSSSEAHPVANDKGPRPQTAWDEMNQARPARVADPATIEHRRVS